MPFTDADRALARQKSAAQRRKQQQIRRKKVLQMHGDGMSKTAIANELKVNYRTVWKDLKESK